MSGCSMEDVGVGLPGDVAGGEVKEPARLVIEQHDGAVPFDREHAIAHVPDHVPEEHVLVPRRFRLAFCHVECYQAKGSKGHAPTT